MIYLYNGGWYSDAGHTTPCSAPTSGDDVTLLSNHGGSWTGFTCKDLFCGSFGIYGYGVQIEVYGSIHAGSGSFGGQWSWFIIRSPENTHHYFSGATSQLGPLIYTPRQTFHFTDGTLVSPSYGIRSYNGSLPSCEFICDGAGTFNFVDHPDSSWGTWTFSNGAMDFTTAPLWFNAAVDGNWSTVGNWWLNSGCSTPAPRVPGGSGSHVTLLADVVLDVDCGCSHLTAGSFDISGAGTLSTASPSSMAGGDLGTGCRITGAVAFTAGGTNHGRVGDDSSFDGVGSDNYGAYGFRTTFTNGALNQEGGRLCASCDQGNCTVCDQTACTNCDQGSCYACDQGACRNGDVGPCASCDQGGCFNGDHGFCNSGDHGPCWNSDAGLCSYADYGACLACDQGACSNTDAGYCYAVDQGPCTNCDQGHCGVYDAGPCNVNDAGPCRSCDQGGCLTGDVGPCANLDAGRCISCDQGACLQNDQYGPCTSTDLGPCSACDQGSCGNGDHGACANYDVGPCSNGDQGPCLSCDQGYCATTDVHGICTICDQGPCSTGDNCVCSACDQGICISCDQAHEGCATSDIGPCASCDQGRCYSGDVGPCLSADMGACTNTDIYDPVAGACVLVDSPPVLHLDLPQSLDGQTRNALADKIAAAGIVLLPE